MKAKRLSLILYCTACLFAIGFNLLGQVSLVLYSKSVIIPSIFIYYWIANNYKIETIKVAVFLFCFAGDIFNLVHPNDSGIGSLLAFLMVYICLLIIVFSDFKKLKFRKQNFLPILISFIFIGFMLLTVLTLDFIKIELNFYFYVIYGIVLSLLCVSSLISYVVQLCYAFLYLVLMTVCFLISDVFYMVNHFYLSLPVSV